MQLRPSLDESLVAALETRLLGILLTDAGLLRDGLPLSDVTQSQSQAIPLHAVSILGLLSQRRT
jgi:hypothetical protein